MTVSLGWLTPFSAWSDVSAFSRNLLGELARTQDQTGVRASILVNPHGDTFWSELPSIPLTGTRQDIELLASFDYLVYNIGNNHLNHRHINRLALSVPGVVIVHDLVMQHYLVWDIFEKLRRPDLYAQIVGEHYGRPGLDILAMSQICSHVSEPVYAPWDTHHAGDMPLIEPFLRSAAAVVVHSRYAERLVEQVFHGPILRLQLPHDQKPAVTEEDWRAWVARSDRTVICSLVTFGHITRNKCFDTLVRAFAGSSVLRDRARLTIAGMQGDAHYLDEVRMLIAQAGLEQIVTIELDVANSRLLALKESADAFVNLRYPNTESASGSLNEQLNAGKPVVLFPTGAYAEVDADAAIRVERESGVAGLAVALERLVLDPDLRVRTGARGREWVRRIGRREYVEALLGFMTQHESLLRQRRGHRIVRRAPYGSLARGDAGGKDGWLDGLARARRVLTALDGQTDQLDPDPFRTWPAGLLVRFINIGVFGEAVASPLEARLTVLIPRVSRVSLFGAVTEAFAILRLAREPADSWSARARTITSLPSLRPLVWECLVALRPEIFIACCFVGLLGRQATQEETQPWLNRVHRGEPVRHVLRDFIAGVASQRASADPPALRRLLDWTHDTGVVTVPDFAELPVSANVDMSIRLPSCGRFLVSGWHHLEPDGVWSSGSLSTIGFRLLADDASGLRACRLAITGRFPAVHETGPRQLHIRHDGIVLTEVAVPNEDWFTATVDLLLEPDASANVLVEFDTGRIVNMLRDGIGVDRRDLGFCLRKFRVEALAAPGMGAEPAVVLHTSAAE